MTRIVTTAYRHKQLPRRFFTLVIIAASVLVIRPGGSLPPEKP
ncbi:MAG TPA: hypothetical protein VKI44_43175 [Acetobacteraceae bacterium]|jgi:hypothetical protein|nr:hypothetical protein [Acetobacteraceae bacterium]